MCVHGRQGQNTLHTHGQGTNAGCFSGKAEGTGGKQGCWGVQLEGESCCPGRSKARQGPVRSIVQGPEPRETRGCLGSPEFLGTLSSKGAHLWEPA